MASTLISARSIKHKQIDKKTQQLIGQGFLYDSKFFSLTLKKLGRVLAYMSYSDINYPIEFSTLDDNDSIFIGNKMQLGAFYDAAVNVLTAHTDSGMALKNTVNTKLTIPNVFAVIDLR